MTIAAPPNWGDNPMTYIQRLAHDYNRIPVSTWAHLPDANGGVPDPSVTDLYNIKLNALRVLNYAETGGREFDIEWIVFAEHVRVAVEEWLDAVCPEFA